GGEMLAERRRIERLDAQAEVIQVGAAPGLLARRGPRLTHRNNVDQRAPGTKLREPDRFLALLDRTAEYIDIEFFERRRVRGARHSVTLFRRKAVIVAGLASSMR